ncbi:hypothetical protein Bhyg_01127 [Pseudolycoriella hygida]|uniref:Uncharacterized protein n=1 Tax=Pseudolycoriella hygida TaxID=35572 RepID=A0A9Q0N8Z6_9DIPT|nr:hypothetical protein Bhyg_01127 [Pseudolycoriella hygida]
MHGIHVAWDAMVLLEGYVTMHHLLAMAHRIKSSKERDWFQQILNLSFPFVTEQKSLSVEVAMPLNVLQSKRKVPPTKQ